MSETNPMLISVSKASKSIFDLVRSAPLQRNSLGLDTANGRVLAQNLYADRDYPPYDRVMMDGICYSSHSESDTLTVIDTINAGDAALRSLGKNEAWRINTGAALPEDCDLVVPVEELTFNKHEVKVNTTSKPYQFVHRAGSDKKKGECILAKGSTLNAATLSLAASIGALTLSVYKAPRVLVLTTGQEAIPPNETPNDHQIRRSHPTALTCALESLGITEKRFLHLHDNFSLMRDTLKSALKETDVILTCGAISKGSSDFLGQIFRDLLGEPIFHGVSQRPGRPLAFWATPNQPLVFALPGNALSVLITFHRYVAPALKSLMGHPPHEPPLVRVEHTLPEFHLTRFLPIRLDSSETATLLNPQNSGDFSQLAGSHGFVEIPAGNHPDRHCILPCNSRSRADG